MRAHHPMKIAHIHKFQTPYGVFEFFPVSDVPGHTHRLVVDEAAEHLWVPKGQRISAKTAQFYVRLWCALRAGLPRYHYVDSRTDPPAPASAVS